MAEDAQRLLGRHHLVAAQVPLPIAHLANALGIGQAALAQIEIIDGRAGPQHVAHPVRQDGPVDGLGDEVGGPHLEGAVDGLHIVQPGHHHHRHLLAARQAAQGLASAEAVHHWHADIHQHQVGQAGAQLRHRQVAVGRLGDQEAGLAERGARQAATAGIVIDHQDGVALVHRNTSAARAGRGGGSGVMRPAPVRRSAAAAQTESAARWHRPAGRRRPGPGPCSAVRAGDTAHPGPGRRH